MRHAIVVVLASWMLLLPSMSFGGDWPMLAHDPARSGSTADSIELPAKRAWVRYFVQEGFSRSVQPVISKGRLYVGALSGAVISLDAATGADVWTADVGSPVFHSVCVGDGAVVAGLADGRVVALDAATGRPRWSYRTGAALWNAPLMHDGRVVIGGRDGWLYCLASDSGDLLWKYETGVHIHQSPAMDINRGAVYVTDEALVVHAVDVRTGKRLWRSPQLWGVSARSFYPVVGPDDTVMTTTIPIYESSPGTPWGRSQLPLRKTVVEYLGMAELGREDLSESARNHPGMTLPYRAVKNPKDWRISAETRKRFEKEYRDLVLRPEWFDEMQESFRRKMAEDPATQCLFLLDPETGRQRALAPVMYTTFCKSQQPPPVVTPDGEVITKWVAFLPSTHNAYQPLASLAKIEPATGRMAPLFDELRLGSGLGLRLIGDESCQISVAGRYLLNLNTGTGEFVNTFDLADPQRKSLDHLYEGITHWHGTDVIQRVLRGQADQVSFGQERITQAMTAGSSAGGGEGIYANMPPSAADGRVFWADRMFVIALEHTDGDRPRPLKSRNLADFGVEPLSEAELSRLTDTWPIDWDAIPHIRHAEHLPAGLTPPPGTRQNPDDAAAARADDIPDDVLDGYIDRAFPPAERPQGPLAESLRAKLIAEVTELISQPLWRAYRFQGGKARPVALHLYADPSDHLLALAEALPHLPAELREKTIQYVLAEWNAHNPVIDRERYPADGGTPREFYRVPDGGVQAQLQEYPVRPLGRERLQAAWRFAERSGQWEMLDAVAEAARTAHSAARPDSARPGRAHFNDYVSGLIAACRICRQRGDRQAEADNRAAARTALRERIAHELRYSAGNVVDNIHPYDWPGYARWRGLTPAVAEALREHAGPSAEKLVRLHLDRRSPFWFLTWGPVTPFAGENAMQLPANCMDGFLAKAYLQQADAANLALLADVPGCRADPLYITKLAMALDACRP